MPRILPHQILHCLRVLLDENGGIKGVSEVKRIITLMTKFCSTLVSKVCYVLILRETSEELLTIFMAEGGWTLIFQWLGDAIGAGNNPFIKEVLKLLIKCPISVDRLKESNAPRTIKGLSKDSEDEGVRELARKLVELWLAFIKSGRAAVEPAPVPVTPMVVPTSSEQVVPPTDRLSSPPPSKPETKQAAQTSLLSPFKIVVRDGQRVLMHLGAKDSTGVKVQKDETPSSDPPLNPVLKEKSSKKIVKVRELDEKVVKPVLNDPEKFIVKIKPKESPKSNLKVKDSEKRKDSDKKDKDEKRDIKTSSSSSSSSKSSHKSSSSSSSHSKSKDPAKDKSKDKHKEHSSSRDSKDRHKDGEKGRSRDRDSSSSSKSAKVEKSSSIDEPPPRSTPAISSLGKIPKKTSSSSAISAAEASATGGVLGDNKSEPAPLPVAKKGTYSDERKRTSELKPSERPKTVKTLPTKFRSTGLEEEAKPPPSRSEVRKKERKEEVVKDAPKRSLPIKDGKEKELPPEKKPRPAVVDIKDKLEKLNEKPVGIKLIPPKPKPCLLESDMFSDALTASASKEPRKKKRKPSISTKEESRKDDDASPPKIAKSTSPPSASSPTTENKAPKFYRDTLDDADADIKKEVKQEEEEEQEAPRAKYYPEGVLLVHKRKGPKKSLRWRPESQLVSVQYFELDETERVNVSRQNFVDLKAMERNRERESLLMYKMGGDDNSTEKMPWGPLFIVDVPPEKQPPPPGQNSVEKDIQLARQKTVLEAIFFTKSMIPDSPAEPDPEKHPMTDPKPIPLEDASGGKDTTYDYSSTPWPEPKPDRTATETPSTAAPFVAPGYATSYPGYPQTPSTSDAATWRPEEGTEAVQGMSMYPPPNVPIAPNMYGMPPPFAGPPPAGPMLGPDGYPLGGMFPPAPSYPMQYGPMGPPMGPPVWGGFGPRPPLPLEPRNICRSWKIGSCMRGNNCRFLHPGENCPPLPSGST